jgi:mannose-6-phosphate isomerase-like protein (cupin superfamily)
MHFRRQCSDGSLLRAAHPTDEVVIVLEGAMEFSVHGKIHHPKVHEELLIPASAVHSARNIGSSTAHWLYGYHRS